VAVMGAQNVPSTDQWDDLPEAFFEKIGRSCETLSMMKRNLSMPLQKAFLSAVGAMLCVASAGEYADAAETATADGEKSAPAWRASADFDAALFLHSRSLAIGHVIKPALRVTVDRRLPLFGLSKLRVGGQAFGIVDSSEHYRAWGLMASALYPLVEGALFHLDANLTLGAGLNADILHSDLEADIPVIPYGSLGLRAAFSVYEDIRVGTQIYFTNLSVLSLGAGVSIPL